MKISSIIFFVLIVQVSASFLDVFQGAMHTVQNSFGKLLNDVVTDVKETVDCTILTIEHVFSLSADATALYNDKCGKSSNTTVINQPKDNDAPTLEISFLNNSDNPNKLLPEDIDRRINDSFIRIFHGYYPHDKLADVDRELVEGIKRLAGISAFVKQELEKLSAEFHIDLTGKHSNDSKHSVDNILQELRLLEGVEQHIGNSSEVNDVHKLVKNVLHKLNEVEASEFSQDANVAKILKDLENNSNGTYKDFRKRLAVWKTEEDRHLNLIKEKIEEHKTKTEHSVFIGKNKLNNILQYQPTNFFNYNGSNSNSSGEIINKTHTTIPVIINKRSKMINNNSTVSNATSYGFATNMANISTSTVSTILSTVGSLPKNPFISELVNNTSLTFAKLVASTSRTLQFKYRPIENIATVSSTTDSRTSSNVSTASLASISTSRVSTTLPIVESLPNNSSVNELVDITLVRSDKPVPSSTTTAPEVEIRNKGNVLSESSTTESGTALNATLLYLFTRKTANATASTISTTLTTVGSLAKKSSFSELVHPTYDRLGTSIWMTTPKIKVGTIGNKFKASVITDSGLHLVRSYFDRQLQPVFTNTTPALRSISVTHTPMNLLTISPSLLETSVKIHGLNLKSNDSEKIAKSKSTTASNILLLKTSITVKPTTAEQIITPIGRKILSTITQIDDDVNTTPVLIHTSSYVNKQKSTITEAISNTVSSAMDISTKNILNQDLLSDYDTLTTIEPSTTKEMTIIDEDSSTTPDVTSEISTVISTTQRHHLSDNNFSSSIATKQSSNKLTTAQVTLKLSKQHTITTPSLDAVLKYVDHKATSTPTSAITSKEIPDSLIHKEMQYPWLAYSQNILSRSTPEITNINSIAPLKDNDRFATLPYDHSASHFNEDIPSLTGFKPLKTAFNDPSLSIRNSRFMNEEKLLPARNRNTSLKKGNEHFSYARINNDNAFLKRKMSVSSLLMPPHTRHEEISATFMNKKAPLDFLNHKSVTRRGTNPKHINFDDPDYESFFYIPSKDTEHERALKQGS